jgi:hypothetical protein
MLRDLAADAAGCKTVEEASGATMGTLANNAADVPFAMLYLFSEDGRESPALKKQPIEPNSRRPRRSRRIPFKLSQRVNYLPRKIPKTATFYWLGVRD